jgi:hypothetical protein
MFGDIAIKRLSTETLQQFADAYCRALGLCSAEERFSDNYGTGHYFRADALGISVIIEDADDAEFSDFDFWITFRAKRGGRDETTFERIGDLVAVELAAVGYSVIRVSTVVEGSENHRVRRMCAVRDVGALPEFIEEELTKANANCDR